MDEILEGLIIEGERLSGTIKYIPVPDNVWRTYDAYTTTDPERHKEWLSSAQRFVRLNYEEDLAEVDDLVKTMKSSTIKGNHQKILGILKAIKLMPQPKAKATNNSNSLVTINNSNSQSQSQEQQQNQNLVLEIFVEAIKDELTGRQQKEIKAILEEHEAEPEETKNKIIEKLKSFGSDVVSNVLANIITNPVVWSAFN